MSKCVHECFRCGQLVSVLENGTLHVHFAHVRATRPCCASYTARRRAIWPFEQIDDAN